MSKAAKQSILILIFLLIGSFSFLGYTLVSNQRIVKEKDAMQKEFDAMMLREKKYITENKSLKDQLKTAEEAKAKIQGELDAVNEKVKGFDDEIAKLTTQSDDWKSRVQKLQEERQKLLEELKKKPEPKIVYKYREKEPEAEPAGPEKPAKTPEIPVEQLDDKYWASILKEKASIELELENLSAELSTTLVELEEFKKENADLQLQISNLTVEKETIEREIKHGKDLADTLSLELARAKGDKKFVENQFNKVKRDNEDLQSHIKKLLTTKVALEKSIVRLTADKNDLQKKLVGTESIIQNKIEEIWQIKETLTKTADPKGASKEIELPPIIVSANASSAQRGVPVEQKLGVGFDGSVVNINNDNNFVIIDLGKNDGVAVGDRLGIYRNTDYIAEVEVIQVRTDISAADIKQTTSRIKVGDTVK